MKCISLPGLLQMVRSVLRHHQEAIARKEQQGRDERQKLKKIANTIAKEVKQFWDSINRVCARTHTHTQADHCRSAIIRICGYKLPSVCGRVPRSLSLLPLSACSAQAANGA